jgi:uncharacterized flavoprotein (TIGR03862 family)
MVSSLERQDAACCATDALVIGGGPAGLMAAEILCAGGHDVLVAEQKPSLGRKFLMAGKSGLNLTKAEPPETCLARYDSDWLAPMLRAFGPDDVQDWARGLGQPLFTGSTGRVFPEAMKASPLLRAWLARLTARGVALRTRWRFDGWDGSTARFETPDGPRLVTARVTILAMGGGSWARLGSDGRWAAIRGLAGHAAPFAASNTGLRVAWSERMQRHYGAPLKAVRWSVRADGDAAADAPEIAASRGEAVISERGLEGGGLYPLIPALRPDGRRLRVDLAPDLPQDRLAARLGRVGGGLSRLLRNRLRWPPAKIALLHEFRPGPVPADAAALAALVKALPVPHGGPRPLDEAISTAGGLRRAALSADLELLDRPGVFACGEMLDWDAPTGGYLLTGCLATGRWAGQAAERRLAAPAAR